MGEQYNFWWKNILSTLMMVYIHGNSYTQFGKKAENATR